MFLNVADYEENSQDNFLKRRVGGGGGVATSKYQIEHQPFMISDFETLRKTKNGGFKNVHDHAIKKWFWGFKML